MSDFELKRRNWNTAVEHANRLEIDNARQPLLYSSYLIARTQAEVNPVENAGDPYIRQKL